MPGDIQALLGDQAANRDHLPLLEEQFGTRAGLIPFVGAGMSAPFGLPQWGAFLTALAAEAGLQDQIAARLAAAEYEEAASDVMEGLGARRFQDLLAAQFGDGRLDGRRIDGAVAALLHLPPGPIITTNFDRVIETAFAQGGRKLTPYWHSYAGKGSEALQQDRPFLLKLHGDWDDPAARVLTLEEYRTTYGDAAAEHVDFSLPVPTLLFKLLTTRCCLFLGCSLRQDRTIRLLRAVARDIPDLVHYAIVERPADEAAFHARAAELSSQSIRPIWYPTGRHDLIRPVLAHLAERAAAGIRRLAATLTVASRPVANNLPDLGGVTIGRDSEIAQLGDMLRAARLVTVTGVGGCGKSRLAVEVARAAQESYDGGVWFVQLADLARKADREGVLPTRVGRILGVPEQPGRPPHESLAEHLKTGRFLLVLDNCEHLIVSCRTLADYLLTRCPDLTIVATSRRPLNLPQERFYPLAPLQVPDAGAGFDQIASSEAVQLFVDRAKQRAPSWQLEPAQAAAVAEVCRALDGIPLAIEVAAARLGVQSVAGMAAHSRDLLTTLGNNPSGDLRTWTLRAALRWSYGLLRPAQQQFMRAMTVFDGGWTAEAAAAVVEDAGAEVRGRSASDVLDRLQELFEQSLLVSSDVNGVKRFRYLEPVRQMVQLELADEELEGYEQRHADFFLRLTETAAPHLLQADQAVWLDTLQVEVDNLRRVLRWSVAKADPERGLRMMAALWRFAEIRGFLSEGRMRGREILGIPHVDLHPAELSRVLSGVGILAYRQADLDEAAQQFARSLDIEKRLGNRGGIANALNDLGIVASTKGEWTRSRELYGESLALEQEAGNARGIAVAQFNLGTTAFRLGEYAEAERLLTDSLARFRNSGNDRESAFPYNRLAELFIETGRRQLARDHAEAGLARREAAKDTKGIADSLRTLGWLALENGDLATAGEQLRKSLTVARGVGDKQGITETFEFLALLRTAEGQAARAIELWAAAEELRGMLRSVRTAARAAARSAALDLCRGQLTPEAYDSAWRRGASWRLDEAIASVLDETAAA